jgi:hypothetical protein
MTPVLLLVLAATTFAAAYDLTVVHTGEFLLCVDRVFLVSSVFEL